MAEQSMQSPILIAGNGPQGQERHGSPYRFKVVHTWQWPLDSSHWARHLALTLSVQSSLSLP